MDLKEIETALSKYGQIKKVSWEEPIQISGEFFKVKRERINVDMVVTKNIPLFMIIKGIKLNISYQGQMKTCSKCGIKTFVQTYK